MNWNWKYYSDENHSSLPLIATYDALRFIFNFNKMAMPSTLEEFNTFKFDSIVTTHFNNVSKQMGYTVLPPEMLINDLANQFLQQNNLDKALNLFEMNIKNYPQSLSVYDSMGDLYDAKGEKKTAMEYYAKALTLGISPETKAKLDKLKSEK